MIRPSEAPSVSMKVLVSLEYSRRYGQLQRAIMDFYLSFMTPERASKLL